MSPEPGPSRAAAWSGWVGARLDLAPEERVPALLLAAICFLVTAAFLVGRATADALFVARMDTQELPYLYAASTLAAGVLGSALVLLRRRVAPELVFPIAAVVLGSALLVARLAFSQVDGPWLIRGLYVGVDVVGAVALGGFWLLVEDVFGDREESRLFGAVEASTVLGTLAAGAVVFAGTRVLAPADLLVACVVLLWLSVGPAAALVVSKARTRRVAPAPALDGGRTLGARQRLLLAGVFVLGLVATTLVDYELKTRLASKFPTDAGAIARFLGNLLFVGALLAAPLAQAAGAGIFAVREGLWPIGFANATGATLRYSVHDTTVKRAFLAIPRRARDQAHVFVEGLLKPFAVALAAIAILAAGRAAVPATTLPAAAAVAVVLVAVLSFAFRAQLGTRRAIKVGAGSGRRLEGEAAQAVRAALASTDLRRVESGLELAHLVRDDLSDLVAPHLAAAEPRIRHLACDYVAERASAIAAVALERCLQDPDPAVRASAIRGYSAIHRVNAVETVRPFLESEDADIVIAAATSLVAFGGNEGNEAAAPTLRRFLLSDDAETRERAAKALGAIGTAAYIPKAFEELLVDVDHRVVRAALAGAGRIRAPEFLPAIVAALGDRRIARHAERALERYGEPVLAQILEVHATNRPVLVRVAQVLGRLATPRALEALVNNLIAPDEVVRTAICQAIARGVRQSSRARIDRKRIRATCLVELGVAYRALAAAQAFELPETGMPLDADPRRMDRKAFAASLLGWALAEKHRRALDRIFLLLGALHPSVPLSSDPARYAITLEALDGIRDTTLRRQLRSLLEPRPRAAKLREAAGILRPPVQPRDAWLRELLSDENTWVLLTATAYAGAHGVKAVKDRIAALLERSSPAVRETALDALESMLSPRELPRAVSPLIWDEYDPIKKRVDRILERIIDVVEYERAHGALEEAFPS